MTYHMIISTISKVNGNHNPSFVKTVEAIDYDAACAWIFNRYHNQVVIHDGYPLAI